ncbi:MAG: flavodoxin family protein [Desulfobaccales bacterium]
MKIVAVLGSPRPQGNSACLARQFLTAARELGAEVQEYQLNTLNFRGCQGCLTCKTESAICSLEDDLAPVLAAIQLADVLVLASPVYYGDLIGQLKCFFDRTYSFFNPDFSSRVPEGKQAVMILAQANPDPEQFADIFPRYKRWLKLYGFEPVRLLRAVGVKDPGDLYQQPDLLAQAATLARELVQPG